MTTYSIDRTTPTVYLDKAGKAVQGYLIQVTLYTYDEVHEIRVPSLDKTIVETAINKLLEQRKALDSLGK